MGAAAGGFTRVLLARGAGRVYAVDAGHGQLRGSLRQDPRVVNLEGVNLGTLDPTLVPDPVSLFTVDVSYLSLADAIPQLARVSIAAGADLVALVKPMFELALPVAPVDDDSIEKATALAADAATRSGWTVLRTMRSPVTGARGAPEALLHARRS